MTFFSFLPYITCLAIQFFPGLEGKAEYFFMTFPQQIKPSLELILQMEVIYPKTILWREVSHR